MFTSAHHLCAVDGKLERPDLAGVVLWFSVGWWKSSNAQRCESFAREIRHMSVHLVCAFSRLPYVAQVFVALPQQHNWPSRTVSALCARGYLSRVRRPWKVENHFFLTKVTSKNRWIGLHRGSRLFEIR